MKGYTNCDIPILSSKRELNTDIYSNMDKSLKKEQYNEHWEHHAMWFYLNEILENENSMDSVWKQISGSLGPREGVLPGLGHRRTFKGDRINCKYGYMDIHLSKFTELYA